MAIVVFAAFDVTGLPLTGLSPTWLSVFDAILEAPISPEPVFTERGGGFYEFTLPVLIPAVDLTGIIDLGATAFPRHVAIGSCNFGIVAAYDGSVPLTGQAPTWLTIEDTAGTPITPQPTISEIATTGLYKYTYPVSAGLFGIIDLQSGATPRHALVSRDGVLDVSPPIIANVLPPDGTQLVTRSSPISFDVTDIDPGLQMVLVTVKYTLRRETQVVFDGSVFVAPYLTSGSQVSTIANGLHFEIVPENQWLGDIEEFFVYAIDKAGNLEALP